MPGIATVSSMNSLLSSVQLCYIKWPYWVCINRITFNTKNVVLLVTESLAVQGRKENSYFLLLCLCFFIVIKMVKPSMAMLITWWVLLPHLSRRNSMKRHTLILCWGNCWTETPSFVLIVVCVNLIKNNQHRRWLFIFCKINHIVYIIYTFL